MGLSFVWYSNAYFSLFLASSKECAKAFHAAGSKLVLCGRDSEKLKELVQELCAVKNHRKNVSVGQGQACGLTWPGFLLELLQKLENCLWVVLLSNRKNATPRLGIDVDIGVHGMSFLVKTPQK